MLLMAVTATSCYHKKTSSATMHYQDTVQYSEEQIDSMAFAMKHHYTTNYNFIVKADSLSLLRQQPEEKLNGLPTDSLCVYKGDAIVVAEIRTIGSDPADSVWVQVARDQQTIGWLHESVMLKGVTPDDPISLFISTFSDVHLLIFLIVIVTITVVYVMRKMLRHNAKLVHFNDIPSFYPTLLTLLVAASATLYASIQLFAADTWQNFYFHPTLNPFSVPPILSVFLFCVWSMLIVGLATVDVVNHALLIGEGVMYMCGLASVCAINYIVFSLTTLYYVGYILLIAYCYFAINIYLKRARCPYLCGNCGARMHHKGTCPECGAENK